MPNISMLTARQNPLSTLHEDYITELNLKNCIMQIRGKLVIEVTTSPLNVYRRLI